MPSTYHARSLMQIIQYHRSMQSWTGQSMVSFMRQQHLPEPLFFKIQVRLNMYGILHRPPPLITPFLEPIIVKWRLLHHHLPILRIWLWMHLILVQAAQVSSSEFREKLPIKHTVGKLLMNFYWIMVQQQLDLWQLVRAYLRNSSRYSWNYCPCKLV